MAGLFLGSCTAPGGRAAVTPDVRAAAPVWKEHEIRAGESQSHPVFLEAGQFVRAVVDQVSADVAVWLLDPQGQKAEEMDSLDGRLWDEELAIVAERSGPHQIVVHWPGRSGTGLYRLRLEPPRPATEADRLRVEAVRLTQQAAQRMLAGGPEALRDQVRLREQALPLWIRVGDRQREAETLYQLGTSRLELGEREEAARNLRRAAELFGQLGATTFQAAALNQAGRVDWVLGQLQEARENFEHALPLARRQEDRRLLFDVLSNLGRFHTVVLGEPQKAIDLYLGEASALAPELAEPREEARSLIRLGLAYDGLSEYEKALDLYGKALDLASRHDLGYEKITALNNLGDTYHALGELERADQHFRQVLAQELEARTRATTLQNLGVVLEKLNRIGEALEAFEDALALAEQIDNRDLQASILTNRGYLHLGRDEYQQALEACQKALPLAADRKTRARTLHILGSSHRTLGDLPAAREALGQALELSQEDLDLKADITMVLAKVEKDAGHLEKAGELAGQAIAAIEELRDRVVRQDLRESFLAAKYSSYQLYVDILMELERRNPGKGFAGRALDMNERARARGLLDLLAEVGADLSRDADADLLARERQLRSEISALYQHRLKLTREGITGRRLEQAGQRLDETIEKLYRVTAEIKASSPHYAAFARPEPLTSAQIQEKVLDRESVLLEYALGEDRSWLWVVTPDSIQAFELPGKLEIEKRAREFYNQISRQPPDQDPGLKEALRQAEKAGADLARVLLPEAKPLLDGRLLLVVSDGALHYVPFGALPLPTWLRKGKPSLLLERSEVVYLPSASTLAVLREDEVKRQRPERMLAAFGDPVFQERDDRLRRLRGGLASQTQADRDLHRGWPDRAGSFDPSKLSRLRFTEEEVDSIIEFAGPERSFKALGLDANLAAVTSGRLADYRIVHFATHGLIYTDTPELSGLVFSTFDDRAQPVDGFLRLTDVYALRLNADLVTLSACETALGQEMHGEGLIGLTRGFMYAGSSRVLATLWKVDDRSTMKLMKRFYEAHLRQGRSAPAALREAQSVIRSDRWRRHPYYWAGFSLQGESR